MTPPGGRKDPPLRSLMESTTWLISQFNWSKQLSNRKHSLPSRCWNTNRNGPSGLHWYLTPGASGLHWYLIPDLTRTKIESYYTGSDANRMWQGLQTITDYKGKNSRELPSDTSLPDELNYFNARFEANNTETCMRAPAVLMWVKPLDRSTFTRPQGQTDYQDVYCEHALTN